jgi:hypothetical protein
MKKSVRCDVRQKNMNGYYEVGEQKISATTLIVMMTLIVVITLIMEIPLITEDEEV